MKYIIIIAIIIAIAILMATSAIINVNKGADHDAQDIIHRKCEQEKAKKLEKRV